MSDTPSTCINDSGGVPSTYALTLRFVSRVARWQEWHLQSSQYPEDCKRNSRRGEMSRFKPETCSWSCTHDSCRIEESDLSAVERTLNIPPPSKVRDRSGSIIARPMWSPLPPFTHEGTIFAMTSQGSSRPEIETDDDGDGP